LRAPKRAKRIISTGFLFLSANSLRIVSGLSKRPASGTPATTVLMRMYPHHSQPIKYGGISRFPQDTRFTKGTPGAWSECSLRAAASSDRRAAWRGTRVVAVAYTLHHPAVPAAIVGARQLHQIEGTIAAVSFVLSHSEYQQLRNFAETIAA
jgi:predicted oxidoreductase